MEPKFAAGILFGGVLWFFTLAGAVLLYALSPYLGIFGVLGLIALVVLPLRWKHHGIAIGVLSALALSGLLFGFCYANPSPDFFR